MTMQHRGNMDSRRASIDMRKTSMDLNRMRSHTGITITPAHSGLPGLDEEITTADLHALAALNNSFTSQNKKWGAPQRHRDLSFTRVLPGTPRGLDSVPVLQTLVLGDDPGTPKIVTGSSVVSPFAQSQQQEQQQEQEQQHLLPQQNHHQHQQTCHKQHQHLHHATRGFNAMKAFAVLAVMLVCSVGLWTSHQAGVLGPMVRRQLVSRMAQGSATGAGLACPIGSYYGGVNGCRGCGVGLTTRAPGAMKLEDCVAPAGSFKHRPRVGRLCDKGTFSAGFNSRSTCTLCPTGMTTAAKGATSRAACTLIASLPSGAQSGDLGSSSSSPSPSPSTTDNLPDIEPQLQVLPGASPLPLPSPVDPTAPVSSPQPDASNGNIGVDPNSGDLEISPAPSPAVDGDAGAAVPSPSPAPRKINLDNLQVVAQPIDLEPLGRKLLLRGR